MLGANTDSVSAPTATSCYEAARVSLLQLQSFVAVAEEGHVGRAAQRMHVSQPPLTRRIRALEDELGVRLFARTPKGMTLRPEGHRLLPHARAILAQVDVARRELSQRDDVIMSNGDAGDDCSGHDAARRDRLRARG